MAYSVFITVILAFAVLLAIAVSRREFKSDNLERQKSYIVYLTTMYIGVVLVLISRIWFD